MSLVNEALRAGHRSAAQRVSGGRRIAVVAGAGGPLGSAVIEQVLGQGGFERVRALVSEPVKAAMRGFEAQTLERLQQHTDAPADTGFIVFDRERHANGREVAFVRPRPEDLVPLAQCLHDAGVRRLIVVLPHGALLPQALKQGLATLDEHAVAALGFDQVVFVRSAQAPSAAAAGANLLQRLAHAVLAQLHWMVPQREQPVRAVKVAAFVAQLARRLPQAAHGTRVVPPELVWHASQDVDLPALVDGWLQHGRLPDAAGTLPRY
jgi:hypothetical protein